MSYDIVYFHENNTFLKVFDSGTENARFFLGMIMFWFNQLYFLLYYLSLNITIGILSVNIVMRFL